MREDLSGTESDSMNPTVVGPEPMAEANTALVPLPPRQSRNRLIMCRWMEGQSVEQIALAVGLEAQTVRGILHSPLVKQEMAKMSQGVVERVETLADEAIDTVRDTMRGQVMSELRFKAAKDLLDRNRELNPKVVQPTAAEGLGEAIIRALTKQAQEKEAECQKELPEAELLAESSEPEASGPEPEMQLGCLAASMGGKA